VFCGGCTAKLKSQPKLAGLSRQDLMAQVEAAAHESEEKSEDAARSFVSGDAKVTEFAPDFLKHRKRYHELMAKMEGLAYSRGS